MLRMNLGGKFLSFSSGENKLFDCIFGEFLKGFFIKSLNKFVENFVARLVAINR